MLTEKDIKRHPGGDYDDKSLFIETPIGLIRTMAYEQNFLAQLQLAKMIVAGLNLLEIQKDTHAGNAE